MELTIFSWVIKKYKIIIFSVTILSMLTGFILNNLSNNELYKASAVLMVTSGETEQDNSASTKIDYMTILANKEALKTYSQIVKSTAILKAVLSHLDFPTSVDQLRNSIWVQQIGDTELMEIGAVHENPQHCVTITNALGNVFVEYVGNVLGLNNIKLVAPAVQTGFPVQEKNIFYVVAATFLGFILSTFGCLIFDFVLQPVRCENDIRHFSLPFLGKIKTINYSRKTKGLSLIKRLMQNSTTIPNFCRLLLAAEQKLVRPKTLMVTSTLKGEGKSFVSAGLAVARSQAPGKTILIDTNLSAPAQDKIFGLKKQLGVSNLTETNVEKSLILRSGLPGLGIVTSGTTSTGGYSLFYSESFDRFLAATAEEADLIIIDAPAIMESTEALVLAPKVEGVLLIIQEGTPRVKVAEAIHHLKTVNANILGVALNKYSKFPFK